MTAGGSSRNEKRARHGHAGRARLGSRCCRCPHHCCQPPQPLERQTMRTDNRIQIRSALFETEQTIPEIVQITGLSYSTVKRGLESMDAELVAGTWPHKWKLDVTGLPTEMPLVGPTRDGRVAVGIGHVDNLVATWNAGVEAFGQTIAQFTIEPTDDPRHVAEQAAKAASTLASLAYTLAQFSTKPDWFELSGGNLEDDQVS